MKSIPSKNYLCFALLGALSLSSFILSSCQPAPEQQVGPTNTRAPLLATATATAEEVSTDTPTMAARASATPTSTEKPTPSPTLTSLSCFHLIYPGNGTTISGASTIQFRWDAQPGAQLYILTVIHPDMSRSDIRTKNTKVSVSLKKASKTARYTWYVNAFGFNGNQICNSAAFSFTKKRGTSHSDANTPVAPQPPEPTPIIPPPPPR